MYTFVDRNGCEVQLSFSEEPLSDNARHVLVICMHHNQWLLTNHKQRGLEFPGGKVYGGETTMEAAKREVKEETGAIISDIHYIGQYMVNCGQSAFFKTVYFAEIESIEPQTSYFETNGPVLLKEFPANIKQEERFSFIMKDDVLTQCMAYIKKKQLVKESC